MSTIAILVLKVTQGLFVLRKLKLCQYSIILSAYYENNKKNKILIYHLESNTDLSKFLRVVIDQT